MLAVVMDNSGPGVPLATVGGDISQGDKKRAFMNRFDPCHSCLLLFFFASDHYQRPKVMDTN